MNVGVGVRLILSYFSLSTRVNWPVGYLRQSKSAKSASRVASLDSSDTFSAIERELEEGATFSGGLADYSVHERALPSMIAPPHPKFLSTLTHIHIGGWSQ